MLILHEYDIAREVMARHPNRNYGYYNLYSEVGDIFEVIADELEAGNRIQVREFGTFEIKERAPRTGRNPHTGETVPIPATDVPNFRPSKKLKEKIGGAAWKTKSSKKK